MLASLRRWTGGSIPDTDIPIEATIAAMDAADVDLGLLSAWRGPNGQDLISNDEVAEWITLHPKRFAGLATVDLDRPMAATRELRRRVKEGFVGLRVVPWLWNAPPTDRRYYPLFAECVELGGAVLYAGRSHRTAAAVGDRTPDSLRRPGGPRLSGAGHRVRSRRLSVDRGDGRRRPQARERLHRYLRLYRATVTGGARSVHENRYGTTQSLVRHQLPDDCATDTPWRGSTNSGSPTRLAATFCAATQSGSSGSQNRR